MFRPPRTLVLGGRFFSERGGALAQGNGDAWTVKRCLDWSRGYLERKGDDKARLAAEWLLGAATGLSRIELYMDYDRPLSLGELDRMHKAVVRRAKGEPLQYIVGRTAFRFIEVDCEPGVLIPRPETELLVDQVLEFLDRECGTKVVPVSKTRSVEAIFGAIEGDAPAKADASAEKDAEGPEASSDEGDAPEETDEGAQAACAPRVVEVGCGTGCIALSIASERPGVSVVATDISPAAVALAVRNRDRLGLEATVDIREGDLLSPVSVEDGRMFDVLVSNPPYIPTEVMAILPAEVAGFEPELALDGGADGLDVFRRLVSDAPRVLRPGGLLACELHETTLDAAADVCRAAGMGDVRIVDDLAGRPRIILARV